MAVLALMIIIMHSGVRILLSKPELPFRSYVSSDHDWTHAAQSGFTCSDRLKSLKSAITGQETGNQEATKQRFKANDLMGWGFI